TFPFLVLPSRVAGASFPVRTSCLASIIPGGTMSVSKDRARPNLERLEVREVPAVQAFYNAGTLSVVGDSNANDVLVKAASDGTPQVTNNGQNVAIKVLSGSANRSELTQVNIEGKGGDDRLVTDGSLNTVVNGALAKAPTVTLLGGAGND